MKNPKKPTYDQKKRIAKANLNPKNFLVINDDGYVLLITDKETNKKFSVEGKMSKEV